MFHITAKLIICGLHVNYGVKQTLIGQSINK